LERVGRSFGIEGNPQARSLDKIIQPCRLEDEGRLCFGSARICACVEEGERLLVHAETGDCEGVRHFEANTAARQITEGIAGVRKFGIEHGDGFRRAWGLDVVVICDDDIDAFLARISDFRMVRDATVDRDNKANAIIFGKIDSSIR